MSWIRITQIHNIPIREGRAVTLGERHIAIFNLGNRFAAIDNKCPHSGGPLCDSIVSGDTVVCPLHGWKISLKDGSVLRPELPVCIEIFATRVEHGVVSRRSPKRGRRRGSRGLEQFLTCAF